MKIIPFGLTLSGLLLKGKDRKRAEARYNLFGEELERTLLAIDYDTEELRATDEFKIKKLDIDKHYDKIDNDTYLIEVNKIQEKDETKQKLYELKVLRDSGKITGLDYIKRSNDIVHKPWVAIKSNYNGNDEDNMEIEVAYNDTFIENMRKKGLPGDTPEEVAEQWLRLFLISNLEEEDLKLIGSDEDDVEDKPTVSRQKIGKSSTFIS